MYFEVYELTYIQVMDVAVPSTNIPSYHLSVTVPQSNVPAIMYSDAGAANATLVVCRRGRRPSGRHHNAHHRTVLLVLLQVQFSIYSCKSDVIARMFCSTSRKKPPWISSELLWFFLCFCFILCFLFPVLTNMKISLDKLQILKARKYVLMSGTYWYWFIYLKPHHKL